MTIELQVLTPEDWALWRQLRLAALAEAPQAFGSTLAEWSGVGDTEERWRDRLSTVPFNVVARQDGVAVGMASVVVDDEAQGRPELISMWVAPLSRGTGVSGTLISAVLGWAAVAHPGEVVLRVREDNARAAATYRRHGFVDAGRVDDPGPAAPVEHWMVRQSGSRVHPGHSPA
ncbi:MAG: GNAT family N-acetyltransferase [Nocardioidaceae bacterium]